MKKHYCISLFLSAVIGIIVLNSFELKTTSPTAAQDRAVVELGRYLFYDNRLSATEGKACATCHDQRFAFTDGYRRSMGLYAEELKHNAPSLFNLSYFRSYTWDNATIETLEQQLLLPLFSNDPPEMGLTGFEPQIIARLETDTLYPALFRTAFGQNSINMQNVVTALAAFCNSIESFNSPFDRNQLSESAERGRLLFISERLNCAKCHSGPNFNQNLDEENATGNFANTGLYNTDMLGAYPNHDQGLIAYTKQAKDMGKFRVPSLRNLGFTAPYFHDGTVQTLQEIIDIYSRGGRYWAGTLFAGDGSKNLNKNPDIRPFNLTPQEEIDLTNFLMSLNDSSLLINPQYANPFQF